MEVKWKSENPGGETHFSHGLELAHGKKKKRKEQRGREREREIEMTGSREVQSLKIFIFPHQLSGESLSDGV